MAQPKRCSSAALLLTFLAALGGPLSSAQNESPTTPPASLAEALSPRGVRVHMAAFQRVADENGGTRAAGTPGYAASLRYVEGQLRRAGYRTTRQAFEIETNRTLAQTGRTVSAEALDLEPLVMESSPNTPAGGLEAPLALAQDALGCSSEALGEVRDKIVLTQRGVCTFAEKARSAATAGAAAVLVYNDEAGGIPLSGSLGEAGATIPSAGITREVGERLRRALENGELRVRLELRTETSVQPTANLLAEWPGSQPERVVMVGAHLDSVEAGPGINDNASGSALVLELALGLAQMGDAAGARFAFWGAEELGLLGSYHYVETLSSDGLSAVRAYLNFDMVASPNAALFTYGDPELTDLFQNSLEERDLIAATTDLGGASDHAPFHEAGVPVAGLFTGASGDKSAAQAGTYGGAAGVPYDACYHQACDTLSGTTTPTSRDVLGSVADAAADTLQRLLSE